MRIIGVVLLLGLGCGLAFADRGDMQVLTEQQMAAIEGQVAWFGQCTGWGRCIHCASHLDCRPDLPRCNRRNPVGWCDNEAVTYTICTQYQYSDGACTMNQAYVGPCTGKGCR